MLRTGISAENLQQAFRDNLHHALGRSEQVATKHDHYFALALTVRDRVLQRTVESLETSRRLSFC